MTQPGLARRLRLVVVTDPELPAGRSVEAVVRSALAAGAPAIQLRDKEAPPRRLLETALRLRDATAEAGALLFLNDRYDVAIAAEADGVHLGPRDLPVGAVRSAVPGDFLIGFSTDDPTEARRAVEEGADYIGCGTVHATTGKADAGAAIGAEGLARVCGAVEIPVVGIGGITPANVTALRESGAAGVAVMGAIMGALDPGEATRALLRRFAPS